MKSACLILTVLVGWSLPNYALAAAQVARVDSSSQEPIPALNSKGEPGTAFEVEQYALREHASFAQSRFEGGEFIYVGTAILIVLVVILLVILLR